MRSRLFFKLWLASTIILLLSMGLFALIGIRLVSWFGQETARSNEENILESAEGFLARDAHDQAGRWDEMFRRLAGGAVSISRKACRIYDALDLSGPPEQVPASNLVAFEANGVFMNAASSQTMVLYWGSSHVSLKVEREIASLSGIDEVLSDVLSQNSEIIAAYFVSDSGMARYQPNVHNGESIPKGFDIRNATWYQKAAPLQNPEKTVAWSSVYSDVLGRGLMVTAAMPAYDASGRFRGAAGVDVTLDSLLKQIGADAPSPHKIRGMFAFLLDETGRIIAFPENELGRFGITMDPRHLTDSSKILSYTLADSGVLAVQRLGEQIQTQPRGVFHLDIGDDGFIVASHFLASTGWRLNLVVPRAVILASVLHGRQQLEKTISHITWAFVLVSACFMVLSLVAGTFLFLRYLFAPLRELEKGAARVRDGDLSVAIPETGRDEIGSLASSFNQMLDGLRKGRELEQTYTDQLQSEIQKKTQELEAGKGELEGLLKTVQEEVRERKEIEAALRRSEAEKSVILNSTTEMFAYYDLDLRIRWANKAAGACVGQTAEALIGRRCYEIWGGQSEPCEDCPVVRAAETGEPQQIEKTTADGRVWRVRGYPVRDDKGDMVALVEFAQEITAQRQAEAEKARMEVRTRQLVKAESLGRMAGAIAHHFNNQLQVVMGNLQIAMGSLPQSAAPVESMSEALNAAHRAARVSGQMLTYLGQTPSKRETLDLADVCRSTLPMLQAGMPQNVHLKTDLPSEGPAVHANQNQMEQVLTHLVVNAWEAMSESGGGIGITVKTVFGKDIPPGRRYPVDWQPESAAYACLEVRDDGPGISERDMERLFDPFFTTKFTGRGLGLPVVLGIVRAHGGGIAVESPFRTRSSERGTWKGEDRGRESGVGGQGSEDRGQRSEDGCRRADNGRRKTDDRGVGLANSEPGTVNAEPSGSVFRVFLLVVEGEVSRAEKKSVAADPATKEGGTVLLVEDTEQVRKLGVRMLEFLGFTVLAAKDGIEGVEIFRERRDDIRFVLSDLTMPRMDGWATIAALREIDPNVRIILASGYDEASVMSGDHAERPQVFLAKAYSLEDLRAAISKVQGAVE